MPRLLFEKKGNAVWISHLDLMRMFQRAFNRARLRLTHTQGFNPRPSVSIALPLSVGVESRCELLDFDLECPIPEEEELISRLNAALVEGVRVLRAYADGRKLRDLCYLNCDVVLEYDGGVPAGAGEAILTLLDQPELNVEKKNRNGVTVQNIASMIRERSMEAGAFGELILHATVCCQNPTLNPAQIIAAIEKYLPELAPDFFRCCRVDLLDREKNQFR